MMTERFGFDAGQLSRYLQQTIDGAADDLRLDPISGGQSNPTFFVTTGRHRLVLRKQPAGPLLPSAHAIDREYRVQSALADSRVAVPRMVTYCDDTSVIGTPFYLMERVEGTIRDDNALSDVPVSNRMAYFNALAQMLARIHAVDVEAAGLSDYGRPGNFAERQIMRWSRQWELSADRSDPAIDRLIDWLPRNVPADDRVALVHGDFRLGNVMFASGAPRIVAVLDWELSTLGHPLADLAHTCIYTWFMRPEEYGRGLLGENCAKAGLPDLDTFAAAYFDAAGCEGSVARFWLALALFRNAVIFEGIANRARSGNASSGNADAVGRLAPALAARGAELTGAVG